MKPKKRPLLNFFKKVFGNSVVRGTIKGFPVGAFAYQLVENISHAFDPEKKQSPLPHSAISILCQAVVLGLIIYAFFTKQITIDQVFQYLNFDDFKTFGVLPTDSIQ